MPDLKDELNEALKNVESGAGLAFSGGVDSSLVAKALSDAGKKITLVTIGFDSESDMEFAGKIADSMGMRVCSRNVSLDELESGMKDVLETIDFGRIARFGNCVCFYYVFKLAKELGIKQIVSANGSDELFCGYSRYKNLFPDRKKIERCMLELLDTAKNDKKEVDKIAYKFGIEAEYPLLSDRFVEFALSLPIESKIRGRQEDLRKHAVREAALEIGVPKESALKPKKAFQYSSGLQKAMVKLAKIRGFKRADSKKLGFGSEIEAYIASLK